MRNYLLASLVAGIVYMTLGPAFVHFVLPPDITDEFVKVFRSIEGDSGGDLGWQHVALVLVVRLLFGAITMLLFAWFRRGRPRFRAARLAGTGSLVFYVALLGLQYAHGLPLHVAFIGLGYCLVETQLAAHLGAIVWGNPAPKP